MQTGSSLLRMFLKKVFILFQQSLQIDLLIPLSIICLQADKGNQVHAQPQAFFLPLGEGEEGGGEADEDDEAELGEVGQGRETKFRAPRREHAGQAGHGGQLMKILNQSVHYSVSWQRSSYSHQY